MRHKILWITFWTILTFWLGSAWGCASFTHEPGMGEPMQSAALPDTQPAAPPLYTLGFGATIPLHPGPAYPYSETQPSLNGLDRSAWQHVELGPDAGPTVHKPIYFHNYLLTPPPGDPPAVADVVRLHERGSDTYFYHTANTAEQMDYALRGADAQNWGARNAIDLAAQPGYFYADFILLPYHVVTQPPWTKVTTP